MPHPRPLLPLRPPPSGLQGAAGLAVAQQSVTLPSIMYFLKQFSR